MDTSTILIKVDIHLTRLQLRVTLLIIIINPVKISRQTFIDKVDGASIRWVGIWVPYECSNVKTINFFTLTSSGGLKYPDIGLVTYM